jgi:hypothetical protein
MEMNFRYKFELQETHERQPKNSRIGNAFLGNPWGLYGQINSNGGLRV